MTQKNAIHVYNKNIWEILNVHVLHLKSERRWIKVANVSIRIQSISNILLC